MLAGKMERIIASKRVENGALTELGPYDAKPLLATSQCPAGAPLCAPPLSTNFSFNFNYTTVASACPLPSGVDGNIVSCLGSLQPCKGNSCAPGTSSKITPAGAC